jgi:hypothetical protein
MNVKEVKIELRYYGITLRVTECGEYRVNFVGGMEATAYYTDDLYDAFETGRTMSRRAASDFVNALENA